MNEDFAEPARSERSERRAGFRGPCPPLPSRAGADSGQLIILTGFIAAIALIAITLMLSDIIYSSNTASIETIQSTKFDTEEVLTLVRHEVDFARRVDPDSSSLASHLTNFSLNASRFYAARGIAVGLNWSNVTFGTPVVQNTSALPAAIAYCGRPDRGNSNESGLRSWMTSLGINFTDYSNYSADGGCQNQSRGFEELRLRLCRGSSSATNNTLCNTLDPSVKLNVSAAIFEFDRLALKDSDNVPSVYCGGASDTSTGGNFLNKSQCQTLQNWTYLGGTLIKTGANDTNSANNTSILDLFTVNYNSIRPNNSSADLDVRRLDSANVLLGNSVVASSCIVNNSTAGGLFKNAPNGSVVNFSRGGLVFQKGSGSNLTLYAGENASSCAPTNCAYGGTGVCGTAVGWTYGSGKVFYFPQLQGEVSTGNRVLIDDPDNLRPILNLFPYGGNCQVGVTMVLGSVAYTTTLYC